MVRNQAQQVKIYAACLTDPSQNPFLCSSQRKSNRTVGQSSL